MDAELFASVLKQYVEQPTILGFIGLLESPPKLRRSPFRESDSEPATGKELRELSAWYRGLAEVSS
jgi:hypothetical protein